MPRLHAAATARQPRGTAASLLGCPVGPPPALTAPPPSAPLPPQIWNGNGTKLVSDGTCLNGTACKDLVSCCNIAQFWNDMSSAYSSKEFSSSAAYFYGGRHTALVRVQNTISGFTSAAAAVRLDIGERPPGRRAAAGRWLPAACRGCALLMPLATTECWLAVAACT